MKVLALVLGGLALGSPTAWWTGALADADPRHLALGSLLLRGGLLACAAFLMVAARWSKKLPSGGSRPRAEFSPWIWLVLLVSLVLRLPGLDSQLWFDEIWMVLDYVRHPVGEVLRSYPSDNNHPLYSVLAWSSAAVFGESAWSVRLPAAIFGVASVLMLYVFARERLGAFIAGWAALVLAISSHHIAFSQSARGYTGLLFFTLLSSHCFLKTLEGSRSGHWWGHGIALALGVYVHLTVAFVAVGQACVLFVLWFRRNKTRVPHGAVQQAVLGFGLAIVLGFTLHALILPQMWEFLFLAKKESPAPAPWTSPLWTLRATAESLGLGLVPGLLVLSCAVAVAVCGVGRSWKRSSTVVGLLLIPGLVSAFVFLALGRNLWPRLFFFLAGFGVLVCVQGILGILAWWHVERSTTWRALAVGLTLVASVATLPRAYAPKQDYLGARRWISDHRQQGEPVATVGMAMAPYRDYYAADYVPAETLGDLERIFGNASRGYVLITFPIHLQSRHPEIWSYLTQESNAGTSVAGTPTWVEVARYPGSIGGGDIVILGRRGS